MENALGRHSRNEGRRLHKADTEKKKKDFVEQRLWVMLCSSASYLVAQVYMSGVEIKIEAQHREYK